MKIEFFKIKSDIIPFDLKFDDINFNGILKRKDSKLVECKASLSGNLQHICDRCGEDMSLYLNEELNLLLSDGLSESDTLDIVEFFDKKIDLNELAQSEIEAIKSGYHYCEKCKNL